jgi:hypothetical protein
VSLHPKEHVCANHAPPPCLTSLLASPLLAAPWPGLLCLQQAKEGGLSRWCSSITIYNEILAARPDLAPVMSGTWYFDRKNEIPPGKAPYFVVSIANFYQV